MADLNDSVRGKTDLRDKVSGESRGRFCFTYWKYLQVRRIRHNLARTCAEGCADIIFQAKKTIEPYGRSCLGNINGIQTNNDEPIKHRVV